MAALSVTTKGKLNLPHMTRTLQLSSGLLISGYLFCAFPLRLVGMLVIGSLLAVSGLLVFSYFGCHCIYFLAGPILALKREAAQTHGPAQAEALWAMKVLRRELLATIATMSTSLIY